MSIASRVEAVSTKLSPEMQQIGFRAGGREADLIGPDATYPAPYDKLKLIHESVLLLNAKQRPFGS